MSRFTPENLRGFSLLLHNLSQPPSAGVVENVQLRRADIAQSRRYAPVILMEKEDPDMSADMQFLLQNQEGKWLVTQVHVVPDQMK